MLIDLYVNRSEKNRISKTITDKLTLEGTLKQQTSIIEPSILIEIENPSIYNYFHIPLFRRYYYISNIESIRNGLWVVHGKSDVLMSFDTEIRNAEVLVSDSEWTNENYMSGGQWLTSVKTKTDILSFSNGFNDNGEYILITSGGVPSA